MNKNSTSISVSFLTGCILISTIAMVLIITSLLFFVGVSVASWQFPASFILTGALYFYISKSYYKDISVFLKSILICVVIIVVSILIAAYFYDVSYDGQTYHMEAIFQLKNGWNPFKNLLRRENHLTIYINHYSKGVELPQSTIYSLTNHIEAAKATNFILLAASFCLCLSYLSSLNRLSNIKCVLISLLAALNPVVVNQLISTYVDGQLATLLLCFFIMALWVIKDASYTNLLLLGATIIITANIKFTGLVYIIIFAVAFLAWLLFTRKGPLFKKVFYAALLSGFIAVFIVGYNPYVINTVDFQHPFYPLMGKNKVDIMGYNLPKGFEGMNAVEKFFTSLFSHTDNVMPDNGRVVRLKIPFALNKADIVNASKIDARVAGFGPMFSGVIILTLASLIILLLKPVDKKLLKNSLYFIAVIIVSIILIPEAWWARYVPQLWYIPLILLLVTELYEAHKLKWLKIVIYGALIINVSLTFIGFGWNYMMTSLINYQLEVLKASHKPIVLYWQLHNSNRVRLIENNIPYVVKDLHKVTKNTDGLVHSSTKFLVDTSVNLPKTKFIKWAEQYQRVKEQ